jgi:glucosyl-3-phosphoglycerate synthase
MDIHEIDKWVNSNTYDYKDYNISDLQSIKNSKKLTIGVIIPVLEEEKTIGIILDFLIQKMTKEYKLVDEIIVIDGGSKDNTLLECNKFKQSINLLHEKEILSSYTCKGKGNQLWKGLYMSNSDIIVYMDSDLQNFDERYVIGIIGPLLTNDNIKFVKGFYDRKFKTDNSISNEGGRVTELCARPLINLIYHDLSGFIQPLSGEYGGYSNVLKNIYFTNGYSVEMKILIEILNKYGLNSMAQVNLHSKEHNHQPLTALTKMSFTIMKTMLEDFVTINNNLLITKKNSLHNTNNNVKIRSEEHSHCNSFGNEMKNEYLNYSNINNINLPPIYLLEFNKNNIKNNQLNNIVDETNNIH